jgi:hypothetical protein
MNLQELYQEEKSTFKSDGQSYDLNKIFKITDNTKLEFIPLKKIVWLIPYLDLSPSRVEKVDVSVPIVITEYKGKTLVIDGAHRLMKANKAHLRELPAKRISADDFEKCKKQGVGKSG